MLSLTTVEWVIILYFSLILWIIVDCPQWLAILSIIWNELLVYHISRTVEASLQSSMIVNEE